VLSVLRDFIAHGQKRHNDFGKTMAVKPFNLALLGD
jgi:hypothetical protein